VLDAATPNDEQVADQHLRSTPQVHSAQAPQQSAQAPF
jgi:hypothetical protein